MTVSSHQYPFKRCFRLSGVFLEPCRLVLGRQENCYMFIHSQRNLSLSPQIDLGFFVY